MGSAEMIKSKKLALLLALGLTVTVTPALAATKSPTPTPKATATKKVTPTPKASPSKKAPVKKKVSTVTPSPSPKWPPAGFKTDPQNETKLYMKIPTAKELVGLLSTRVALATQVKDCTKFTCGAVLVASEIGCRWWQVTGEVVGPTSKENKTLKTFGKVTTSVAASAPQKIVTVILVTTEPLGVGHIISNVSADCNQGEPTSPIPNTEYKAAG
jgi:hypothetical protein